MGVEGSDWRPAIVVRKNGSWVVAWDAYRDSYDILIREFVDDAWQPIRVVAGTNALETRVQLACDHRDRVYIAWEEGGEKLGTTVSVSESQVEQQPRSPRPPCTDSEEFRFGVWSRRRCTTAFPLPQVSLVHGENRPGRRDKVRHVGAFYERCALAVDDDDRPWIFYRHFYDPQLGVEDPTVHHIEVGWKVYGRALTADGWSPLQRFEIPQRDGQQRLSLTCWRGAMVAAWGTGRRDRRPDPQPKGVIVGATMPLGSDATRSAPPSLSAFAAPSPAPLADTRSRTWREHTSFTDSDGRTQYLLRGDLHRHTDLSLCFPFFDGSLEDAYRYAIDAAQLDFLAVTDHTRDLQHGAVDGLLWWRNTNAVRQYTLGDEFIPLVGFERSHRDTDHNVISLREDHLRDFPPPLPEYWAKIDGDTITIPHAPFIGKIWEYQDDAKRPLLEIFQGFRDTEALTQAHKALRRGYHMGFIASSDHLSTGASFACVWSPQRSRTALFRSLQARRTFGATADIVLRVQCGENWMGSQIRAVNVLRSDKLIIAVTGTATIQSLEVYRNVDRIETAGPFDSNVVTHESVRRTLAC